jgi:Protein of unknown function (DUF3659)
MAPSPAAGKGAKGAPETPTKAGKNPASSTTPTLGKAGEQAKDTASSAQKKTPGKAGDQVSEQAKDTASSAQKKTPGKAPKLGASKLTPKTGATDSPKLPPRPKEAEKPVDDAKGKTGAFEAGTEAESEAGKIGMDDNDPEETPGKITQLAGAESSAAGDTDLSEVAPDPTDDDADEDNADDEDAIAGAKDTVDSAAEGAADDEGEEIDTDGAQDKANGALGGAKSAAGGVADKAAGVKDTAGKTAKDATDGEPVQAAEDAAEGVQETAEGATEDLPDGEEAVNGVEETAEGVADEAEDALPEIPLSILRGLEVGEDGQILGSDGEPLGQLDEGEPEDLAGQTIGDDGEILDEDGDVIGRCSILPEKAKELAEKAKQEAEAAEAGQAEGAVDEAGEGADIAKTQIPDIGVLEGLTVGEGGQILDSEGKAVGKITEGDPEDFIGQEINAEGEVLDEDGDVIGRAEALPQEVEDATDEAKRLVPDLSIVEGKKLNKKGNVIDDEGDILAELTEGDPKDCAGKIPNEKGEILNDNGDVIGKVEIVPGEAADKAMKELHPELVEGAADEAKGLTPDLSIVEGKKLNRKGNILDDEGEIIAKLIEGDPKDCAGRIPNEKGEILDENGDVLGKVEIVQGEAADDAMKKLHPELAQEALNGVEVPPISTLEGLKVNKKGEVLDEEGEAVGRLIEGEIADVAGKKINDKGEILDKDGNVVGKVEVLEKAEEATDAAEEVAEQGPDFSLVEGLKVNKKGEVVNEDGDVIAKLAEGYDVNEVAGKKLNDKGEVLDSDGNVIGKVDMIPQEGEETGPDISLVEGLKINKNGEVLNEDGDVIAKLAEGYDAADVAGKKLNDKGEILDSDGNVIGKVDMIPQEGEETGPELPPLSILEGLKCNKQGKIVDESGNVVGELIEGDPKKLSKMGLTCDEEGQFWDGKGHVIGRAQTLPPAEEEEEAPFAGLEGVVVVKDGWVEDENENRVGQLVEGDPKKLIGRPVDEDGDVIDKRGNVVGHAERYEEPEEEAAPPPDLSVLQGLTCNKQGNVVGPEGVPIARLVEGNPKELAGRKIDAEGQIWNDAGKVVGRCELIPEDQREAKPEGPFAGLEGVIVVKDGLVEDEDGNVVGKVVEGDPKRLVGRAVDEDGDINDKYGNTIGHCEPYEIPEEEAEDLSSLAGKTVNKQGNVVDEHGTVFGRIKEGDPKKLAGCKVDGEGQIWSDDGKVVGYAELIPGGQQEKPEGPFSGFDTKVVVKDGLVHDAAEQIIGRVIEGDPKLLMGRHVDDDGDILDKNGNVLGKAERWEPEEKERHINPMSGHKVNKDGEVYDADGNLLGKLTEGDLKNLVGFEVDDNGYVIDNDGNRVGACTLLENLDEGPTEEELAAMRAEEESREIAKKMCGILQQTLEKMEPILNQITDVCFRFPFSSYHLSETNFFLSRPLKKPTVRRRMSSTKKKSSTQSSLCSKKAVASFQSAMVPFAVSTQTAASPRPPKPVRHRVTLHKKSIVWRSC